MNKKLFILFIFTLFFFNLVSAIETTEIKFRGLPTGYGISFENNKNQIYYTNWFLSYNPFKYGKSNPYSEFFVFIEGNFSESMTLSQVQTTPDVFNIDRSDWFLLSNIDDPSGYDENAITHIVQYIDYNTTSIIFYEDLKGYFSIPVEPIPGSMTTKGKGLLLFDGNNFTVYTDFSSKRISIDMNADSAINRAEIRITSASGGILDLGNAEESDSGDFISGMFVNMSLLTKKATINNLPNKDDIISFLIQKQSNGLGINSISNPSFILQPPSGIYFSPYLYTKLVTFTSSQSAAVSDLTFIYPKNTLFTECNSLPTNNCFVTKSLTFQQGIYNIPQGITIQAPHVTLNCNGAHFKHPSTVNNDIGIYIEEVQNITLENCNLQDYGEGVKIESSQDTSLTNFLITSNQGKGLFILGGSTNTTLENSNITTYSSAVKGSLAPTQSLHLFNHTIIKNNRLQRTMNNDANATLDLQAFSDLLIENNFINSGEKGTAIYFATYFQALTCFLKDNSIIATIGAEAITANSGQCNIYHNYIEGNSSGGIYVTSNFFSKHGIVKQNGFNFSSNVVDSIDGIDLQYAAYFSNNKIVNNKRGISFTPARISGEKMNVSNNIFDNNGYDVSLNANLFVSFRNNSFSSHILDHSIYSDYCTERNSFTPGIKRPSWSYCGCIDNDNDSTFVYDSTLCPVGNDCDDTNSSLIGVAEDTYINNDVTVCPGFYNNGDARLNGNFIINTSTVVLDCNNALFIGQGEGYGIWLENKSFTTIKNCNIQNYTGGINIYLPLSWPYGYSSKNNRILNNNIINNTAFGIFIESTSSENFIYDNYFSNTINAIIGAPVYWFPNATNHWNTTKTPGKNILGGPFIGGNYWSDYTGVDLNGDGIGDTNLPYTSQGNIQTGGDYLPLVATTAPVLSFQGQPVLGNTITFTLHDLASVGKPYFVALSLGSYPGITLTNGRVIPLNYDLVFLNSLLYPNYLGLNNSYGLIDASGTATATWTIPPYPILANLTFYAGAFTVNPTLPMPGLINTISNAVSIPVRKT